jgi:hypothetical protein
MSEDKEGQLVHQLIEATPKGRITWEPTANLDEFTTSFKGKYSVTVSKTQAGHYVLRMSDEADRELLNLVHGPDWALQYGSEYETTSIRELFDLVRRTALHVDEAIDDIIETLKG